MTAHTTHVQSGAYKWLILVLAAFTFTFVVAIPHMSLPVLFDEISADLGLSLVQVGWIWGVGSVLGILVGLIGGPIGDRLRQLGYHVIDVGFGDKADNDKKYANKTAEMAYRCRQWLMDGGAIADHPALEMQLTNREYMHNDKGQLVLESKKDVKKRLSGNTMSSNDISSGGSPDWSDALYLTFAQMVPKRRQPRGVLDSAPQAREYLVDKDQSDYDPLDAL